MTPAIFGLSGLALTPAERAFFREADPAGYILFAGNVASRAQVRALTDELRALHGRERLLISIDQEGGRVTRMKPPEWPEWPSGAEFDRLFELAPASAIEAARANAEALGLDLAEVGIACTHAPVLDVRQADANAVIGERSYGAEPLRVAALGRAVLGGLARAGVLGTIKHMPGHGRTTVDTHHALPVVTASADELAADLAPFRALADTPIGMTGHLVFNAWDAERPATQSPIVIEQIIRTAIGFDGLLLTDDLHMEALSGTVPDRAEAALRAGIDVALVCWGSIPVMAEVCARAPAMSPATKARLDRALALIGVTAPSGSRADLLAKRDALFALLAADGSALA